MKKSQWVIRNVDHETKRLVNIYRAKMGPKTTVAEALAVIVNKVVKEPESEQ